MDGELHPSQERFRELLNELAEFQASKQAKYSNGDDPFANYRKSEAWGVPAWVACMVRVEDKVSRLQNLANGVDLGEEGAYDAFRDIAVGALNALILWEEETQYYDGDEELPEHGTNHDDAIAAQTDEEAPERDVNPIKLYSTPSPSRFNPKDAHEAHDEYKRLGRDPEQDGLYPEDDGSIPAPTEEEILVYEQEKERDRLMEQGVSPDEVDRIIHND